MPEWLTGAPPFDGLPIEVALQHITDAIPPLSEKCPDLPPGVERALAKEPEQGFPTIWSFAQALEQAAQGKERSFLPLLNRCARSGGQSWKPGMELAFRDAQCSRSGWSEAAF